MSGAPNQDERIKQAVDSAIEQIAEMLPIPEPLQTTARLAIAFGVRNLLKTLGIETGKVQIEAGPAADIRVVIRR